MPRKSPEILCTKEQKEQLVNLTKKKTIEKRMADRASIVLHLIAGDSVSYVAKKLEFNPNTITLWRDRFLKEGLSGLNERPRPGKPVKHGEQLRNKILKTLEHDPPHGLSVWDGPALAEELKVSVHAVWRILRKEGVCLARQRSWCVSTDSNFAPKAADIVGLYLNPPENALVISVDEKPSIQALERRTGYVKTNSGKIVRGLKSTYKRHGTLNLFAALDVATGIVNTKTTQFKCRPDFQEFMEDVVFGLPPNQEIHVILDNYCTHKKNDVWLENHPNVTFHFTPTSASWLNQIEIWFGILSRKALRGANFKSVKELRNSLEKFINHYNKNPRPFVWKKRDVVGSQLKNTISNLCN